MNSRPLPLPTKLAFDGLDLEIIDRDGRPWLRGPQIAAPLGMRDVRGIRDLYARHADEFTADMTTVIELPTAGGVQPVRIFSPRGCHLLAMFARTLKAKAFRRWVLDVLDRHGREADGGEALRAEVERLRHDVARLSRHLGMPMDGNGPQLAAPLSESPRHCPPGTRCLSSEQEAAAAALAAEGYSYRQIGRHFGVSHNTARRAIHRHRAARHRG